MSSDRSRLANHPDDGFLGVVAQQGRVVLDRDLNALQDIALHRGAAETLEIIGPCGTPDDGFRISAPDTSPPSAFFSPPETLSPPQAFGAGQDFLIGAGVMYLGGQRVTFPPTEYDQPVSYSYFDQPDWPAPDAADGQVAEELVYLDAVLQEISAVEDPDLLEVALGGPDTTGRLRFLTRVRRNASDASDCATAWQQAVGEWQTQGLIFDPSDMSLTPGMRMQVGFAEDASTGDPCDPVATGGYLGAENQLIRVRIVNDSGAPSLVWGYDNASFLYRITAIRPDSVTLSLAGGPPDALHAPMAGQIVEVLSTAAVLGADPDVSSATSTGQILRVTAENTGTLFSLAQPYGPITQGDPASYIVLSDPVDPAVTASPLPLFLRIWQAQLPFVIGAPITLEDPSTGISTGVTVTFSGDRFPADGAFWEIAVRPSTPQGVYPETLLERPQPAAGPRRYVCPLAVVDWSAQPVSISDCRNTFDNLVGLNNRRAGCCTVAIDPLDLTGGATLQSLIDKAAGQADIVTVCLAAGDYALASPLRLTSVHAGMTLESCGAAANLFADPKADPADFFDGLVVLTGADQVTLRGLALDPPLTPLPRAVLDVLIRRLGSEIAREEAVGLIRSPEASFGVRICNSAAATLQDCTINLLRVRAEAVADQLGAAVFLQGNCTGLTVKNCNFTGYTAPTYTPIQTFTNVGDFLPPEAVAVHAAELAAPSAALTAAQSPPLFNVVDEIRTGQAFTAVMANRGAVGFAARQRPLTATAAILGLDYADLTANNATISCALGSADVVNNDIRRLTFGSILVAGFDVLRLNDNRIEGGVAGLWVSLPGSITPTNMVKGTDGYFQTVQNFEEAQFLIALAAIVPPPATNSDAPAPKPAASATPTAPLNATLFVSGNHIATGTHPPPIPGVAEQSGQALTGTCALLLWMANTADQKILQLSDVSTLVTGNHLLSADQAAPTALVILPYLQPCTVTGNIVLNRPAPNAAGQEAPSLWIVIDSASDHNNAPLAVTGNVLSGISDIAAYFRGAAASRSGWSSYNADPD